MINNCPLKLYASILIGSDKDSLMFPDDEAYVTATLGQSIFHTPEDNIKETVIKIETLIPKSLLDSPTSPALYSSVNIPVPEKYLSNWEIASFFYLNLKSYIHTARSKIKKEYLHPEHELLK